MEKKSDKVRRLVRESRFKEALAIAKGFRLGISKADVDAMTRGYECMVHPEFYGQIGFNPEEESRKGIEAVTRLYGKEEQCNVSA